MPESISFICCFYELSDEAERQLSELRKLISESNPECEIILVSKDIPSSKLRGIVDCFIVDDGCGIYQAMNLGLETANNSFINFNNLGDRLTFIPEIPAGIDLIAFSAMICSELGDKKFIRRPSMRGRKMPCHQAIFTRAKQHRNFNLKYKYAADLDFYINFEGTKMESDKIVCEFKLGGVSNNKTTFFRRKLERFDILLNHYLRLLKRVLIGKKR